MLEELAHLGRQLIEIDLLLAAVRGADRVCCATGCALCLAVM